MGKAQVEYQADGVMPDRRSDDARYVSIFRAGKLTRADGSQELCVLRNISNNGAMLAYNSDLSVDEQVTLDLRLDERLGAKVAWVNGDRCGLMFDMPTDLPALLAGHRAGPRPRPPRLRVESEVILTIEKVDYQARLTDISQTGACLSIDENTLPRVPEFRVTLDGLGDYRAIVCWRRSGFIGVSFVSTLPMWALNDWVRAQR